jgi:hypothetical protein
LSAFFISLVALVSIRAAGKANETILKVFEKQFGVQSAFGAPETVLIANKLILPTIAGGEDRRNIPRGFLSAARIPVFLMTGWVFSLLFDAWLIWYAGIRKLRMVDECEFGHSTIYDRTEIARQTNCGLVADFPRRMIIFALWMSSISSYSVKAGWMYVDTQRVKAT